MDEQSNFKNKDIKSDGKKQVEIGLDISTSVIGLCVLDKETNKILKLENLKLTSNKFETLFEKANEFEKFISEFCLKIITNWLKYLLKQMQKCLHQDFQVQIRF